jgi:hypothetical protein
MQSCRKRRKNSWCCASSSCMRAESRSTSSRAVASRLDSCSFSCATLLRGMAEESEDKCVSSPRGNNVRGALEKRYWPQRCSTLNYHLNSQCGQRTLPTPVPLSEPSLVLRRTGAGNCDTFYSGLDHGPRREDYAALQHDLWNSVNIILGFCSVLQRSEPLIPNHARDVDRIRSERE